MTDDPGSVLADVARRWRHFAELEAPVRSPHYARLAAGLAGDDDLLGFLAALPPLKCQPNLLLGVLALLHGRAATDPDELRRWVLDDADRVRAEVLARSTQTNEPARCAALLPAIADLPGPLALIEVGASAGLCLHPDRYAYDYRPGGSIGDSPVRITCAVTGSPPLPARLPEVAVRVGIDLNPLDPAADADWLRALVWPGPGHDERVQRLGAAAGIAAQEPARMIAGDLVDALPAVVAGLPAGVTPVVLHTAVLTYLPADRRSAFVDLVRGLPVRWVSQEGPGVLAEIPVPDRAEDDERFLLAVDGCPVAWTAPHGGALDWLPG
ncbi:DUF2332 domain-containing protein [Klenkia soli]|uniref:DUF2332 domain-containing protein n=1 Tax=Klenkia soli TaxID=1052260 RepID=UPI001F618D1A|nr:DUF2332 domain-containing protein [Klenkia soli]